MNIPVINVENLAVGFRTYRGTVHAVRDVSFTLNKGEIFGIVGESGCGKSVTANAIMGLLPARNSFVASGKIELEGFSLLGRTKSEMEAIRGNEVSMIFQDPMTSLNPVLTIGTQLTEGLIRHKQVSRNEATKLAIEMLEKLGMPFPDKRMHTYAHALSGGLRQRVVIAMALLCNPKVLLADEPTTALDVTIQAQILELLKEIREKFTTSMVLISHDLGIIAEMCDRVAVMYAGQIVEQGLTADVFYHPQHPYTQGLLASLPRLTDDKRQELNVIHGQPPDLLKYPEGCAFSPRCKYAMKGCQIFAPVASTLHQNHYVCCHLCQQNNVQTEGMRREASR